MCIDMIEQITGVDAMGDGEITLEVGLIGVDGGSTFEIADVREGEAYIDYLNADGGIWLQDNRFTRKNGGLRVV